MDMQLLRYIGNLILVICAGLWLLLTALASLSYAILLLIILLSIYFFLVWAFIYLIFYAFTSDPSTTTVTVVSIIFSIVVAIGIYATEIMPDIDEKEQISKERNIL